VCSRVLANDSHFLRLPINCSTWAWAAICGGDITRLIDRVVGPRKTRGENPLDPRSPDPENREAGTGCFPCLHMCAILARADMCMWHGGMQRGHGFLGLVK
jgi:hypothetical protein